MMSFQTVFDGSRMDMFWERVPDKGVRRLRTLFHRTSSLSHSPLNHTVKIFRFCLLVNWPIFLLG